MVKTFTSWLKHGTAPVLALEPPKRGPFLLLWPFEALRGYREMLKTRDFARREEGDVRFGGYLPCTMVSEGSAQRCGVRGGACPASALS